MKGYILIYILYAFTVYIIALINTEKDFNPSFTIELLIFFAFSCAIIGAFRPEGTQDTKVYNMVYEASCYYVSKVKIDSIRVFLFNRTFNSIELFYIVLMSFFRYFFETPIFFYFVQGFVSNLLMIYGLYMLCEYAYNLNTQKEKKDFISSKLLQIYSVYLLMFGILFTSSAIRDGLSLSLGIVAIGNLLQNKRKILSYMLFLLSILIHSTSLLLILLYFLLKIKKLNLSRNQNLLLCSFVPILYLGKIGRYTVVLGAKIIESFLKTFNIQAFYSYIKNLDYRLPLREGYLLIITAICLILSYKKNKVNDQFRFIIVCGLYMFVFAYPIAALARVLYMFLLFFIPIVMVKSKYSIVIRVISIFYLLPQYIYVFGYL